MIHTTPQPGYIGLTTIPGPVGRFIEVGQWLNGDGFGPYEHAFTVLPNNQLIEAMPGGARVASLSEYAHRRVLYVAPAGLTDAQRKAICDSALKYKGVPYSALDYFALAAHRFHLPVPGLRKRIDSDHSMICSQLCDRAYLDAGQHLFNDGRWPGFVTPMDLFDLLADPSR